MLLKKIKGTKLYTTETYNYKIEFMIQNIMKITGISTRRYILYSYLIPDWEKLDMIYDNIVFDGIDDKLKFIRMLKLEKLNEKIIPNK